MAVISSTLAVSARNRYGPVEVKRTTPNSEQEDLHNNEPNDTIIGKKFDRSALPTPQAKSVSASFPS